MPKQPIEHTLTETERRLIKKAAKKSMDHFGTFAASFMFECVKNDIPSRVAVAALSLFALSNLARLTALASGMHPDDIDKDETCRIGTETQEFLADQMNDFIMAKNRRGADRN